MNAEILYTIDGIDILQTKAEHSKPLEALQKTVFPTLHPDQLFKAQDYLMHLSLFPEGQFVALDGNVVVGMSSTIRYTVDFEHTNHSFDDIIQGGSLSSHQKDGTWLYGADIGVHPEYRRRGIARALYHVRQQLVQALGLNGQVTVGMPSGYGEVSDSMSIEEYYTLLEKGDIKDPTISAQRAYGFTMMGIVPDYVQDPVCANYGIFLVLDKSISIL